MSDPTETEHHQCTVVRRVLRASRSHQAAVFLTILVLAYVATLWSLKLWAYPGWTWRGIAGDLKAILGLGSIALPVGFVFWRAHTGQKPDESFVGSARRFLHSRKIARANAALLVFTFSLILGGLWVGERSFSPEFLQHVEQHNWTHARKELNRLQKLPLDPDLLSSCALFVEIHGAAESNALRESVSLRENRSVLRMLLESYPDSYHLNSRSFAEVSKALFFVEDDDSFLSEGREILGEKILHENRPQYRSLLLSKLGELELAERNYRVALGHFQTAQTLEPSPASHAIIKANIGNIRASQGDLAAALAAYSEAEEFYPEGRRFIFYSNFGYMLMLAGRLAEAETKITRALKIKPDDWYSHLNLGIVYDELGRHSDARRAYSVVIEQGDHLDWVREARIFLGRSYELDAADFATYAPVYLDALLRGRTKSDVDALRSSAERRAELYRDLADALLRANTHGTERFVAWFEDRAEAELGRAFRD